MAPKHPRKPPVEKNLLQRLDFSSDPVVKKGSPNGPSLLNRITPHGQQQEKPTLATRLGSVASTSSTTEHPPQGNVASEAGSPPLVRTNLQAPLGVISPTSSSSSFARLGLHGLKQAEPIVVQPLIPTPAQQPPSSPSTFTRTTTRGANAAEQIGRSAMLPTLTLRKDSFSAPPISSSGGVMMPFGNIVSKPPELITSAFKPSAPIFEIPSFPASAGSGVVPGALQSNGSAQLCINPIERPAHDQSTPSISEDASSALINDTPPHQMPVDSTPISQKTNAGPILSLSSAADMQNAVAVKPPASEDKEDDARTRASSTLIQHSIESPTDASTSAVDESGVIISAIGSEQTMNPEASTVARFNPEVAAQNALLEQMRQEALKEQEELKQAIEKERIREEERRRHLQEKEANRLAHVRKIEDDLVNLRGLLQAKEREVEFLKTVITSKEHSRQLLMTQDVTRASGTPDSIAASTAAAPLPVTRNGDEDIRVLNYENNDQVSNQNTTQSTSEHLPPLDNSTQLTGPKGLPVRIATKTNPTVNDKTKTKKRVAKNQQDIISVKKEEPDDTTMTVKVEPGSRTPTMDVVNNLTNGTRNQPSESQWDRGQKAVNTIITHRSPVTSNDAQPQVAMTARPLQPPVAIPSQSAPESAPTATKNVVKETTSPTQLQSRPPVPSHVISMQEVVSTDPGNNANKKSKNTVETKAIVDQANSHAGSIPCGASTAIPTAVLVVGNKSSNRGFQQHWASSDDTSQETDNTRAVTDSGKDLVRQAVERGRSPHNGSVLPMKRPAQSTTTLPVAKRRKSIDRQEDPEPNIPARDEHTVNSIDNRNGREQPAWTAPSTHTPPGTPPPEAEEVRVPLNEEVSSAYDTRVRASSRERSRGREVARDSSPRLLSPSRNYRGYYSRNRERSPPYLNGRRSRTPPRRGRSDHWVPPRASYRRRSPSRSISRSPPPRSDRNHYSPPYVNARAPQSYSYRDYRGRSPPQTRAPPLVNRDVQVENPYGSLPSRHEPVRKNSRPLAPSRDSILHERGVFSGQPPRPEYQATAQRSSTHNNTSYGSSSTGSRNDGSVSLSDRIRRPSVQYSPVEPETSNIFGRLAVTPPLSRRIDH